MARPSQARRPSLAEQFDLGRALFEIVIVAIGVLLALLVDEARQSSERRQLAREASPR